jgi:hypothetical protein
MEKVFYAGLIFTNPDFNERDHFRGQTITALRNGIISKHPCEICGSKKVQMHHEKYMDYLNIRWLCKSHHKVVHHIFWGLERGEDRVLNAECNISQIPMHPMRDWEIKSLPAAKKRLSEQKRLYSLLRVIIPLGLHTKRKDLNSMK